MDKLQLKTIGTIVNNTDQFVLRLDPKYVPALQGLEGFGYLSVIWWFSDFDNDEARNYMEAESPYKNGPEIMGVFATRSPIRPNPLALTIVEILDIDYEKGLIYIPYIDANNGTPLLDIKPYTPSIDRVEDPVVPGWCSHWPMSYEKSGEFDWEKEFNF